MPRISIMQPQPFNQVVIKSADRVSGSSNNFRVLLPQQYAHVKKVRLLWCSIPNIIPNISYDVQANLASNNQMHITDTVIPSTYAVTLPSGAYSLTSLTNALAGNGVNLTVDAATNIATISLASGHAFTLDFGTYASTDMWDELGFDAVNSPATATSQTGVRPINLSFPQMLYVNIPQLSSHSDTTNSSEADLTFLVPTTVNSYGDITYNLNSNWPQPIDFNGIQLTQLDVSLRIQKPNNVARVSGSDLANLWDRNWQFALSIE